MKRKRDKKEKYSIKLIFNPDLPMDAELIKTLKHQTNMTAYIKFALYHYINMGEKDGALNKQDKMVTVWIRIYYFREYESRPLHPQFTSSISL